MVADAHAKKLIVNQQSKICTIMIYIQLKKSTLKQFMAVSKITKDANVIVESNH